MCTYNVKNLLSLRFDVRIGLYRPCRINDDESKLHAGELVMMVETMMGLWNELMKLRVAFEGKRVNLGNVKVIRESFAKDGLSKSKVDICGVGCLRAKAISIWLVKCGKWIHGNCAGVK